ncbi:hypothetical protein [Bradyrhizobium sp. STM 3557]|uniref:hypothetical protein n=1 Tax=Bradyrhizobium sp. STM 3557 TaxID=578920 RepID=UPI00388FB699
MARLQQETQAAGTTGSAETSDLPCAMVLRFIRALPGDRLSCPRFATMLRIIASATMRKRIARGISTGMPEPRDFTVASDRSSAWKPRCDPTRPPHPAPDVRDDREAPPRWDGMSGSNHNFGKSAIEIFARKGRMGRGALKMLGRLVVQRDNRHIARNAAGFVIDRNLPSKTESSSESTANSAPIIGLIRAQRHPAKQPSVARRVTGTAECRPLTISNFRPAPARSVPEFNRN